MPSVEPAFGDKRASGQRPHACFHGRMFDPPHACLATPTPTKGGAGGLVLPPKSSRRIRPELTLESNGMYALASSADGFPYRPAAGVVDHPRSELAEIPAFSTQNVGRPHRIAAMRKRGLSGSRP
jgi:hypothetical protein